MSQFHQTLLLTLISAVVAADTHEMIFCIHNTEVTAFRSVSLELDPFPAETLETEKCKTVTCEHRTFTYDSCSNKLPERFQATD